MDTALEQFTLPELQLCGESEIRTREPVLPVTRFPGVPLQPLEHLSLMASLSECGCKGSLFC